MNDRLFWDNFEEYYAVPTKEDLMLAPPERYIPVFDAGSMYIEKWTVSGSYRGDRLSIAFPKEIYYDNARIAHMTRKSMEERNHCVLRQLYGFGIPSDEYKKYFEELGAEMEENINETNRC